MEIRKRVCSRVQAFRKEAGLTQEQLAERAQLSVDGIRKIETYRATPSLETLSKLGSALRLPLAQLVGEEDDVSEVQTELRQLYLYLAQRDLHEIRLANRVVRAVLDAVTNSDSD